MKYKHGLAFPDADQYLFDRMPENRLWQIEPFKVALEHCKNFRTAIDGGAHIGTWSLEMAKYFRHVWAFEPANDTYEALMQNIDGKGLPITALNQALGKEMGVVSMAWRDKDKKRSHTGARYITEGEGVIRTFIDDLAIADVDFIKLDLEGGETDALKGAIETLNRCRPVIVFEDKGFNKRFGYPEDSTRTFLADLGAREIKKCGINRVWGW